MNELRRAAPFIGARALSDVAASLAQPRCTSAARQVATWVTRPVMTRVRSAATHYGGDPNDGHDLALDEGACL